MSKFDLVGELFGDIPYMTLSKAELIRDIILENGVEDAIEIGFYQGKSSAYIAAVMEDQGAGHLVTYDMAGARNHNPNIEQLLGKTGLSHRVTPFFAARSYTWELQRLINSENRPQFDFCYFDGGHTWDSTGFGVFMIDMVLRPGGLILLNDLDWSMSTSPHYRKNPKMLERYDADEIASKPVRLVWGSIMDHLGYEKVREYPEEQWGLARKPF